MIKSYIKRNLRSFGIIFFLLGSGIVQAQNTVTIGGEVIKSDAVLYLLGNGSQGLILPAVDNVNSFSTSEKGMVVYQNIDNRIYFWNGGQWVGVGGASGGVASYLLDFNATNNQLTLQEDGSAVGTAINLQTINLAGDLTGTIGAAQIAPGVVGLAELGAMGATDGQILKFNGGTNNWEVVDHSEGITYTGENGISIVGSVIANTGDTDASDDITTKDITDLGSGQIIKTAERTNLSNQSGINTGDQTNIAGNAATVTTNANLTGPVTSIGNATSIASGAITNAMLANTNVANLSGTNTGDQTNIAGNAATVTTNANLTGLVTSIGNVTSISSGVITNAMLANTNVANLSGTNTGDEVTFNGAGLPGIVSDPVTSTGKVLSDNGSWVTSAVTGDMFTLIYDPANIGGDTFSRGNHTGTQTSATISDFNASTI